MIVKYENYFNQEQFSKKEGVVHMVVLHFVYMLVMNKKNTNFMNQSNDSLKKMFITDHLPMPFITEKIIILSSLKILSLLP